MRKRTPQEKKALSYARDRRNDYGENDKTSRRSIRRNKTLPARAYRKTINDILHGAVGVVDLAKAESVDVKAKQVMRRRWKKYPDQPLGEIVARQLKRRKNHAAKGKTARQRMRDFVNALKIETGQEADGRWLAEVAGLSSVKAYGETREAAIERCKTLAGCVFLESLGAVKILWAADDSISVLSF
ncbi:MAG TPA: hypothetical protein VF599_11450 [Pyrinomonadaceae bacterium]|jgi:hypothetical protein